MKIGPLDSKPVASPVTGDRKASGSAPASATTSAKADGATSAGATQASAQVAISSAGNLMASGGADATFDAAKVERIASAIRDGKFQINADKIADKLISNAQDLLKRRPSE